MVHVNPVRKNTCKWVAEHACCTLLQHHTQLSFGCSGPGPQGAMRGWTAKPAEATGKVEPFRLKCS